MAENPVELIPIDSDSDEEVLHEAMFVKRGCCFWMMPCMGSRSGGAVRSNWWERITVTGEKDDSPVVVQQQNRSSGHWWSKGIDAVKKVREWSELVAGPKWKTFIRRFNKNNHHRPSSKQGKFQYDPLSYALNFDEGNGGGNGNSAEDEDRAFRDFSSRFASIPMSAKTSMDLGKDGPTFT